MVPPPGETRGPFPGPTTPGAWEGGIWEVSEALRRQFLMLDSERPLAPEGAAGFCLHFEGRRPLIQSSLPVWSLSEVVNAGFGPKKLKICSAAKATGS